MQIEMVIFETAYILAIVLMSIILIFSSSAALDWKDFSPFGLWLELFVWIHMYIGKYIIDGRWTIAVKDRSIFFSNFLFDLVAIGVFELYGIDIQLVEPNALYSGHAHPPAYVMCYKNSHSGFCLSDSMHFHILFTI